MPNMIMMGEGGSINPERVIMIAALSSAPIKRLLKHTDKQHIINLTYGYPQRSVAIFDNGFIAITRYSVTALSQAIITGKEVPYVEESF